MDREEARAEKLVWTESCLREICGKYYRVRMTEDFGTGEVRFEAEDSFKSLGRKEKFRPLCFRADFREDGTVLLSERSGRFSRSPSFMCSVVAAFRPDFDFMTVIGKDECSIAFSFKSDGPRLPFKDILR